MVQIADILHDKGPAVMTVRSTETIKALSKRLREKRIGAMPVSDDGDTLIGIISERDVAYGYAKYGSQLDTLTVANLMSADLVTCSPQDLISHISRVMTQRRVRHLPVLDGEHLVGVVSIGDVLKHRLSEMAFEADVLRDIAIARH